MNENSKNTKTETSTIFSENFSQNSKSAHSNMYDIPYFLKRIAEAQDLIADGEVALEFAFGFIKHILNGDYTREEALNILGEYHDSYYIYKADIHDWEHENREFLEHFEL